MRQSLVVMCALAVAMVITSWQRSVEPGTLLAAAAEPGGLALLGAALLAVSAWDRRRSVAVDAKRERAGATMNRAAGRLAVGRIAATVHDAALHDVGQRKIAGRSVQIKGSKPVTAAADRVA
jgi:hypothetical protein